MVRRTPPGQTDVNPAGLDKRPFNRRLGRLCPPSLRPAEVAALENNPGRNRRSLKRFAIPFRQCFVQ